MFNKHRIEMKIVKTPKTPESDDTPRVPVSVDVAYLMRSFSDSVAPKVIVGIVIYVAADTLRQVLVKATPQH